MIETIKNVFSFIKIEHTIFSLPLVLTGAWLGMNKSFCDTRIIMLIVFASLGARIFGMSINRILDRNIDASNPRTSNREIPAGKISVESALMIACLGLFFYLISCFFLGNICLLLSPVPVMCLVFYTFLKRFTFFCHFGLGACLALAPLSAFIAASESVNFSLPVVLFSSFVFCWLSGADIIYSIMDVDSDRENGICSLPAKFGVIEAQVVAACVHVVAILIMGKIIFLLSGGFLSWLFFAITIVCFFLMYLPKFSPAVRFFPLSSFAGISGALVPIFT